MELQSKAALEKDPAMDYMLLQGVRFAFRIHQVCSLEIIIFCLFLLSRWFGHEEVGKKIIEANFSRFQILFALFKAHI